MAKKQISDLTVATKTELDANCKFIIDKGDRSTRQISFGSIESKISSDIPLASFMIPDYNNCVLSSYGHATNQKTITCPIDCYVNINAIMRGDEITQNDSAYIKINDVYVARLSWSTSTVKGSFVCSYSGFCKANDKINCYANNNSQSSNNLIYSIYGFGLKNNS